MKAILLGSILNTAMLLCVSISSGPIAIGERAGDDSAGINRINVGTSSGQQSHGDYAVRLGHKAGFRSKGDRQIAVGAFAGERNNAFLQTAVGYQAGKGNTGQCQVAIGYQAGVNNVHAQHTAVGYAAGKNNTGERPTHVGSYAGIGNSGSRHTAIGEDAGEYNAGHNCVHLGENAGEYNQGNQQVAAGEEAGSCNTQPNHTSLGRHAGRHNDGYQNTSLGSQSFNSFRPDDQRAHEFKAASIDIDEQTLAIPGHRFGKLPGQGKPTTHVNLMYHGGNVGGWSSGDVLLFQILDKNTLKVVGGENCSITSAGDGVLTPQRIINNSTGIGFDAEPDASNQVRLGNDEVTEVTTSGSLVLAADQAIYLGDPEADGTWRIRQNGGTLACEVHHDGKWRIQQQLGRSTAIP